MVPNPAMHLVYLSYKSIFICLFFHIGLNSKQSDNYFNWTDTSTLEFTYWGSNEPNNHQGRREDCVHTWKSGVWNDNFCYIRKPFMCKYSRGISNNFWKNNKDNIKLVF